MESRKEIMLAALRKFGTKNQILKAAEEFNELSVELLKHAQGDVSEEAITDELADAYIMLSQMMIVFKDYRVKNRVDFKLKRLKERVENGQRV